MPVIHVHMTKENGGATKEQKEKLQSGITKLFDEIFGRGGKSAVVILHEIDTDDYAIGGESITKLREKASLKPF